MTYIDGFVAAVPTANREKFKKHAEEAANVFKENGVLKQTCRKTQSMLSGQADMNFCNANVRKRASPRGLTSVNLISEPQD
jgi:uncharacterized protein YbaA (DUF1428 family)